MIETLRIRGVAIVDEAQLEFGPGLNVLTGETGTGKSIVLGALELLAGARASARSVRAGAETAEVEAVLRTERAPDLETALAERGLEGDAHELVVARSVAAGGRSRARVSGQLVPVATLAELLAGRVEIASQHGSQALRRPGSHGRALDAHGDLLELRGEVERGHATLREIDAELERLRAEREERARRRDFLAFQVGEIDAARVVEGELERLAVEHARLANAERLRGDGAGALAALVGDPTASENDGPPAADRLREAVRALERLGRIDPALAALAGRLSGLEAELADAAGDLERCLDGVEIDPARLASVEERLRELERLRAKYGASEAEILAHRERAAAEHASLAGADERAAALAADRERTCAALERAAKRLSEGRAHAAARLARTVERSLRELGMPGARLEVALEPVPLRPGLPSGPSGCEAPAFRFSANPGEPPRPLQEVASGGELSRVFLALRGALLGAASGLVLVFDEVDAGIGGRAADRVGRRLAELARRHQVLCITHLPQIAAFADRHFRVEKRSRGGRTTAHVECVSGASRVEELARMAGGERVSEATRRHAEALLRERNSS